MRNNDTIKAYQQKMMDALKANDSEAYVQAMEEMMQDVAKQTAARFEQLQDEKDFIDWALDETLDINGTVPTKWRFI